LSPTTLPEPEELPEITRAPARAFLIGLMAGAFSALLGVGGGLIMVPAMVAMLRLSQHRAVGTSLAVILPTAAVAALQYNHSFEQTGQTGMHLPVIVWLAVGGVVGATIGAMLAAAIGAKSLRRMFGVFVMASGVGMIVKAVISPAATSAALAQINLIQGLELLGVGTLVGVIAGLLGVGGGLVMVPALSFLLGYNQHLAQGTSLAVIIPVSISGAIAHSRRGNIVWPLVGPMALGAALAAAVMTSSVFRIDAPLLRILFGIFMVVIGISMVRAKPAPPRAPTPPNQGSS
jgi:uncharacterized membrane protein YfcA